MSVAWHEVNGVIILKLEDKLMGGKECVEAKKTLQDLMDKGYKNVVLDFSNLEWSNSAGMGAIISCYHSLKKRDGAMKFACPTPKVSYYLNISKLDTVFDIYDKVEDAVAGFR